MSGIASDRMRKRVSDERANAIDKALNTPVERIMKANLEFEKAPTIKATDSSQIEMCVCVIESRCVL